MDEEEVKLKNLRNSMNKYNEEILFKLAEIYDECSPKAAFETFFTIISILTYSFLDGSLTNKDKMEEAYNIVLESIRNNFSNVEKDWKNLNG